MRATTTKNVQRIETQHLNLDFSYIVVGVGMCTLSIVHDGCDGDITFVYKMKVNANQ